MKRSNLLALAVLVLSTAACGSAPPSAPATPATPAAAPAPAASAVVVKAPGDAKIGDTTKCPVSGEEFVVEATSLKTEHDGKTYYFCCGGCKKKFEAEPGKFAKKG